MLFWWDDVEVPDIGHVIYPVIPRPPFLFGKYIYIGIQRRGI